MKSVLDGLKVSYFKILKARGPGKFYSSRTTGPKVRDDDALARENRSRSTGADRERFEALDRRVSSEMVYRDSARHGSSESDQPSGGGHLIERDTLLLRGC